MDWTVKGCVFKLQKGQLFITDTRTRTRPLLCVSMNCARVKIEYKILKKERVWPAAEIPGFATGG